MADNVYLSSINLDQHGILIFSDPKDINMSSAHSRCYLSTLLIFNLRLFPLSCQARFSHSSSIHGPRKFARDRVKVRASTASNAALGRYNRVIGRQLAIYFHQQSSKPSGSRALMTGMDCGWMESTTIPRVHMDESPTSGFRRASVPSKFH